MRAPIDRRDGRTNRPQPTKLRPASDSHERTGLGAHPLKSPPQYRRAASANEALSSAAHRLTTYGPYALYRSQPWAAAGGGQRLRRFRHVSLRHPRMQHRTVDGNKNTYATN